jgi:thiol-disulfide isomerase/thioredoxin
MNRKLYIRQWRKRLIVTLFFLFVATCMSGCVSSQEVLGENQAQAIDSTDERQTQPGYEWLAVPMTNAVTAETFTLQNYIKIGSPVVIHTFAIWCPLCTMQLQESTTFLDEFPGKAHIIGLDVEETESIMSIAQHVEKNGFAGTFAAAPMELSQGLISTFGPQVILQMPHTIIIVGGDIFYLGPGVRTSNELSAVIDEIYETLALIK